MSPIWKISQSIQSAIFNKNLKRLESLVKKNRSIITSISQNSEYFPLHDIALSYFFYNEERKYHSNIPDREECIQIAGIFIRGGIDVNRKNKDGATAIFYAAMSPSPDMCILLLDNGADVNGGTENGENSKHNPLISALDHDNYSTASLLIMNGADPTATCPVSIKHKLIPFRHYFQDKRWKNGVLYFALVSDFDAERKYNICEMLLRYEADPNEVCYLPNEDQTVIKTRVLYLAYKLYLDQEIRDARLLSLFTEFGADSTLDGERFGFRMVGAPAARAKPAGSHKLVETSRKSNHSLSSESEDEGSSYAPPATKRLQPSLDGEAAKKIKYVVQNKAHAPSSDSDDSEVEEAPAKKKSKPKKASDDESEEETSDKKKSKQRKKKTASVNDKLVAVRAKPAGSHELVIDLT